MTSGGFATGHAKSILNVGSSPEQRRKVSESSNLHYRLAFFGCFPRLAVTHPDRAKADSSGRANVIRRIIPHKPCTVSAVAEGF